MKPGRPKTNYFRRTKEYSVPGRYQQRLDSLHAKKQKLEMLRSLISTHENQPNPDLDYIRDLKRRANHTCTQLRVLSTVDPNDLPKDSATPQPRRRRSRV